MDFKVSSLLHRVFFTIIAGVVCLITAVDLSFMPCVNSYYLFAGFPLSRSLKDQGRDRHYSCGRVFHIYVDYMTYESTLRPNSIAQHMRSHPSFLSKSAAQACNSQPSLPPCRIILIPYSHQTFSYSCHPSQHPSLNTTRLHLSASNSSSPYNTYHTRARTRTTLSTTKTTR